MNAPRDVPLGVFDCMPADRYHAVQAMSAGGLKRMRVSPAHFYGLQLDPNRPPEGPPTPALLNGTLTHCAIFEPEAFERRYVVQPAGLDGRTKDGKAWLAEHAALEVITVEQRDAALRQAAAIRALPEMAALLSDGVGERSVFWLDDETGELCKCRPDWTHPAGDGVILVDGKTTTDASPEGFGRAIWNFGYWLQAAWYSDGYEAATGVSVLGFVIAAVESAWPHAAAAYMLGDDVLDRARKENRRLLNLYAECKRTGVWPGYAAGVNLINLPKWARFQENE